MDIAVEVESVLSPGDARVIAKAAYTYGFPLVENYRVLHSYFVNRGNKEFKAPWNTIHNEARVYTPDDKAIQTPNSDTPYSQLGMDLRAEPLVISVPAVEENRYYSLQFIDLYTFNYAYVGSRTTGNAAASFLLAGPSWRGDQPAGVRAVIRSETELGWVQFRTQLFGPGDVEAVKRIQSDYKVQPLSRFLGRSAPPMPSPIEFMDPLTSEEERTSLDFFRVLNFLLRFCPTHPSEQGLMARFGQLGIGANGRFDAMTLSPAIRQAVEDGMADAWIQFAEYKRTQIDTGRLTSADGFGTREFLKDDHLARMASAVLGIYGNSKEEAIYPAYFVDADGRKLDASTDAYTLRFAPGQLPPVHAFWSLTMYELPSSLLVANPLNRYLINSTMLTSLRRDSDGGLTLLVQRDSPGERDEANWLPAPDGAFWLVLRLYWPKEEALDGTWQAPALKRRARVAATVPVTVANFVRAETDLYFGAVVNRGALGKFDHNREPTPVDDQTVVRMNRDTLYSAAVFDLDAGPATITLPDPASRFLSMQVIDEDHYTSMVAYGGGAHTLTRDNVGTRYAIVAVRILVNASDPTDIAEVRRLQDAIRVEQKDVGKFEAPVWDTASQNEVRDALLTLGGTLPNTRGMFGGRDQVDPVRHLIGSAMAWGGNPDEDAVYLNVTPAKNDGETAYTLTLKDVPVNGFWSISVYNAAGYFEPNDANAYSLNDLTAKRGQDGTVTVQFGACEKGGSNCLPIVPGWNYMVRLYRPRREILDGSWKFPEARPL